MTKDPAFLLYSSDFLTGVADLTFEERGQYITMLCIQHQKGAISSKWLSINLPNASSDVLSKFKTDAEGNYYSNRLFKETEKREKFRPKKIAAAVLGGLISSKKLSKDVSAKIRASFKIDQYLELEEDEIKKQISKWFKQMLNLYENENENINNSTISNNTTIVDSTTKRNPDEKKFIDKLVDIHCEYWKVPDNNPRLKMDTWAFISKMSRDEILFLDKQFKFYQKIVESGRFKCTLPNWIEGKWKEANYSDQWGEIQPKLGKGQLNSQNEALYVS